MKFTMVHVRNLLKNLGKAIFDLCSLQAPDHTGAERRGMEYGFTIKGTLPGLNEYLKAERSFRNHHSNGNDMKQQYQIIIANAVRRDLKNLHINKPVMIKYDFYEPNRKRDLDNIAGVAHKFIQDALVKCRVLDNDGWNNIRLLRKEKGLTQKQMGEQLNIPFRTIMNWERGVREPSSQNMVALEKFFNVSGSFLRGETDIREPMIWDDLDVLNSINNEFPQMLKRVLNIFEQEDEDNQHAIFTIISELQSILMSNKKEEKKKVLYMAMLNLKTINDTLKVNKTHD